MAYSLAQDNNKVFFSHSGAGHGSAPFFCPLLSVAMNLWIVTGGIGTGKSHVCRLLREQGPDWASFSSDESVSRAYRDAEIQEKIQALFGLRPGSEGLSPEQRAILRARISASAHDRSRLEEILHPWVFQDLEQTRARCLTTLAKVLVAEVPLYYETGSAVAADRIIVVAASKASQIGRLQRDRGLSEAAIEGMLGIQMPIDIKMARADVVIWNDGSLSALERQVRLLSRQLSTEKSISE